jgi:hypothetical protein
MSLGFRVTIFSPIPGFSDLLNTTRCSIIPSTFLSVAFVFEEGAVGHEASILDLYHGNPLRAGFILLTVFCRFFTAILQVSEQPCQNPSNFARLF